MTPTTEAVRGQFGVAQPVPLPDSTGAEPHGTIGLWLLTCPDRHPAWQQWQLLAVHLEARPGLPTPVLQFPGATHEILVIALDPTRDWFWYTPATPFPWPLLAPVNVAQQITCDSDQHVRDLLSLCAQGVVHGVLDPDAAVAPDRVRQAWKSSILQTLAHLHAEHDHQ